MSHHVNHHHVPRHAAHAADSGEKMKEKAEMIQEIAQMVAEESNVSSLAPIEPVEDCEVTPHGVTCFHKGLFVCPHPDHPLVFIVWNAAVSGHYLVRLHHHSSM